MNRPAGRYELPEYERTRFDETVDRAVGAAALGRLAEGHARLVEGLRRSERLLAHGRPWAGTLVAAYRQAIENYCESYGVWIGPP